MMLRVVSSKNEIPKLSPNEKKVHLVFRASNIDFLDLVERCPRLRMVQVSPSYHKTMSKDTHFFLSLQGIELVEGIVKGHRKDLDMYFDTDKKQLMQISCDPISA